VNGVYIKWIKTLALGDTDVSQRQPKSDEIQESAVVGGVPAKIIGHREKKTYNY
jgi:hypothetical protein